MRNVKYLIGVKNVRGEWLYATDVAEFNEHPIFLNECHAKKFVTIDAARKWWNSVKPYFDNCRTRVPTFDWDNMAIVKYTIKEEVAETLQRS